MQALNKAQKTTRLSVTCKFKSTEICFCFAYSVRWLARIIELRNENAGRPFRQELFYIFDFISSGMDPLTRAEKLKSVRSRIRLIITRLVNRNLKSHLLVDPQLAILNFQKKKVIFV